MNRYVKYVPMGSVIHARYTQIVTNIVGLDLKVGGDD